LATPTQAVRLSAEDSLESGFIASYGEGGRLVGAIRIRQSAETERLLKSLISERAPADALARDFAREAVVKRSRLHRGARAIASGGEPVEEICLGDGNALRDEDVSRVDAPTRAAGRAAT
jgi:hypothetical protein